ncbi:leucine-rich repeat-containing protein 9 [Pygocentrus nattereri]|uniref:Leucine rich repeat containing 9 n=1 Tax=Pygocentrus nattereri TaxID=42514 RepID=A0AAR2LHL2_PYGNA|nr:leucine-rich repeat-containing protein 9 [Pygocentrus nattereri]
MTQSEKLGHSGDEDVIKELCVCNGVCFERVSQEGSGITALEMFFSGFPRMVGFFLFPRLSRLTIMGQSITKIQSLDSCPSLTELWVAECQLKEISGLENCLQLQKLFLYDNKISKISSLELLINLQVLWLNSNCVSEIEGLSTLENLKELNLADNLIQNIGHSLDQNSSLQILNLSGNKISSFKELTRLTRLSKLRELSLKDPQSSPNPVCVLCNYSTHILYHIPTLHRLDSHDVSSKTIKDLAESTVMKKMMYYNMRVRYVQRRFDETEAKLQQQKKQRMQRPEQSIKTLSYTLKHLELELSEILATGRKGVCPEGAGLHWDQNSEPVEPGHKQRVQHKLTAIRERIKTWEQRMEEVEACFQRDVTQASDRKELMTHFLVMELETVGNIRFEEGNTSDAWFSSCYDLLLSRFCVWDYKLYNITGIKINQIIRVHNRALRLRFEDKLHFLLTSDEPPFFSQNYKRCMEYLFYVPDPGRSTEANEALHILENGFKSADSYKVPCGDRAVPLSNSLSACEQLHMRSTQRSATKHRARSPVDPPLLTHGELIVCKVFLGHSVPAVDGVPVKSDLYPKAQSVYRKANTNQPTTNQEAPARVCSSDLQGRCDCSQRQTVWYIFDHELILPEYLIDFEYITQETPQLSKPCASGPDAPVAPADAPPLPCDDQALNEEALDLEPVLKPQPKLLSLDEKSILTAARANVLSQITVLNLHGNSLSKMKEISCLTALRHLTISFNEFTHLDDISHMPNLEFVDASFNRIVSLEGLRGLGRLTQLDLRWNQLTCMRDDAAVLRKHTPSLLRLDTRHNPWTTQGERVRMEVLGRLKTLTHLDGVLVTEEEAAAALTSTPSKISTACLLAHSRVETDRPRCLSLLPAAQLLTQLQPSPWTHSAQLQLDWTSKITALNLDSQRLSRITNLDKLVNLRWASFNNNELNRIEGLEHCPLLEELSLNHNNISSLDGVCKLQRLTRLSVNSNKLQCLDASVLEHLPNLHFLSAERNRISSLHGVQRSRSLFELYVGNNNISTSRDIYHLKALTSLIILDLYGNPLVEKLEHYRVYVIFHLPSLKALDGIAVEVSECENAKDVFGGRLTPDMVTEKLGHSNYKEITDLELTGCGIRMVDLLPADLFVNLHCVNLERNNLTSFSGLIYLPNVKALCLNYNHIESILPRQKAQTHLSSRQALYHKVHSSGYGQQNSRTSREALCDTLEPLMSSLEVLHLSYNSISNLSELQLSRLTNLRALFLQGNDIAQVEGLEGLRCLRELVLDRNRLRSLSVSSFSSQVALLELRMSENRLRDLGHLHSLGQLRSLHLDNNKLQDIAELEKLAVLPSLIELSVVGNPVARRSLHRPVLVLRLPGLQVLDGITITLEERTRAELMLTEGQYPVPPALGVEVVFPGLSPLIRTAARGSSGLQHDVLITANLEDTHHSNKYKKQRAGRSHSRSAQSDSRHRAGLNGHRIYIGYPTDPDSRFHSHGGPKPPPL